MKNIVAIFLVSIVFFSGFSQDVLKLRIDPAKAYGGLVSEYFSDIKYIPLDTRKASLFGDITHMIVTDSSFVIIDQDTRSVLFFDLTGKYLTKISRSANYVPAEIFYNKADRQVIVASYNDRNKVKGSIYTIDGVFVSDIEATEALAKKVSAVYLGEGYYANMNRYTTLKNAGSNELFYFLDISKNGVFYKSLIPYDQNRNRSLLMLAGSLPFNPSFNSDEQSTFNFSVPLENFVYKVTKDTAIKLFQIVFPANYQITGGLLKVSDKAYLDSIIQTRKWFKDNTVLAITNITMKNNRIFFRTVTGSQDLYSSTGAIINRNFIYDMQNGKLSSLERLTPDESSYYLPFWEMRAGGASNIISAGGYLYATLSSIKMFTEKDKNKFRNPKYPPELQQYFNTQNRKSNPVIVRIKLKE